MAIEKTRDINEMLNRFDGLLGEKPIKRHIFIIDGNIYIETVYAEGITIPKEDALPARPGETVKEDREHGKLAAMCRVDLRREKTRRGNPVYRLYLYNHCFYTNTGICHSRSFMKRIEEASWKLDEYKEQTGNGGPAEVVLGRTLAQQAKEQAIHCLEREAKNLQFFARNAAEGCTAIATEEKFFERMAQIEKLKDAADYLLYHATPATKEK